MTKQEILDEINTIQFQIANYYLEDATLVEMLNELYFNIENMED